MDLSATSNLVHLSNSVRGERSLQLEPARGYRVVAVSGDLWVTQAGRIEDYILRPGDALTLESTGPAIVTSFGPADVEVIAPPAPSMPTWRPTISAETLERAQREARRLRSQAMHETFAAAAAWVSSLGRRVVSLVTSASGARPHV